MFKMAHIVFIWKLKTDLFICLLRNPNRVSQSLFGMFSLVYLSRYGLDAHHYSVLCGSFQGPAWKPQGAEAQLFFTKSGSHGWAAKGNNTELIPSVSHICTAT